MGLINDVFSGVEKLLSGATIGNLIEGANARTPENLIQPGDIDLIDIILLSEDQSRTYSLMSQASSIDIYESIMSPVIFCEINIADSIGLLQDFPILGEEYIKITFKTPKNSGAPSSYMFRVASVHNKTVNESNKRLSYTLQCVSAELFRNSSKLITKKTDDTISNVVKDIIQNDLGTQKSFTIDETKGVENILITRQQPLKAIDFLRQRAVSSRYSSSSYCFYENRDGYFFTTIERLIEEGGKQLDTGNTDKVFFFDTSRKDSVENLAYRNILAYNHLTFKDSISQIAEGGINNQIQEFDIITGNVRKLTYTDNIGADTFKNSTETAASTSSTNFARQHGKTTTVTRIVPIRSDKPSTSLPEKLSAAQAYAQKITQNMAQILIPGDSDITIGQSIQCHFPSGVDAKSESGLSRLDSGNYLISKARHMILIGDRPQYTMSLELIKGDLQETV